jgi:hypothetical protein
MDKSIDRDSYTCHVLVLVHGNRPRCLTHDVALAAGIADNLFLLSLEDRKLEHLCWLGALEDPGHAPEVRGGARRYRSRSPSRFATPEPHALADEHEHEHVSRGRVRTTEIDRVVHSRALNA